MLTTESEAKTKRCQEGYAASECVTDGESGYTLISTPVQMSFGSSMASTMMATAPMHCIASSCMAWRWAEGKDEDPRRGFCGKAGYPTPWRT